MAAFLHDPPSAAMAISSDERQFFLNLGERIASLRKARNTTQTQVAEAVAQLPQSQRQFVARMSEMALAQATR